MNNILHNPVKDKWRVFSILHFFLKKKEEKSWTFIELGYHLSMPDSVL